MIICLFNTKLFLKDLRSNDFKVKLLTNRALALSDISTSSAPLGGRVNKVISDYMILKPVAPWAVAEAHPTFDYLRIIPRKNFNKKLCFEYTWYNLHFSNH